MVGLIEGVQQSTDVVREGSGCGGGKLFAKKTQERINADDENRA